MSQKVSTPRSNSGWIPELPSDWDVISLKYCVECLDGDRIPLNSQERAERQGQIPYWGAGGVVDHIDDWLFNEPIILLGEDGAPFNDHHRPVAHYVDEPVWVNNHIHILRTREEFDDRYLCYALNSVDYQNFLSGSTRNKLTQSDMNDIPLPIPPLETQKEIVQFLESETLEIDNLVERKKALLDVLSEKRASTIEERLTKGLEAADNFGTASWSTDLPEDWELRRGYGLFREVDNRSEDGTERLLSLRKDGGLIPYDEVSEKEYDSGDLEGYKIVKPGQLIMNRMRAATGLFGVASMKGIVSPDYAVFRPTDAANPHFYRLVCQTELFKTLFRSRSNGLGTGSAGFLRLHADEFLSLWFPHPSVNQQRELVDDLQEILEQLDYLGELTQESASLLKDRRYSMIHGTVTGQIDVTEEQGDEQETPV